MSTSTPPPATSGDSLPAATPSLPGVALWSDSDVPPPAEAPPVAAFSGLVVKPGDGAMPTIGHIGRYALKYRLGEGGLGTVFAAQDPLLSRLIAVKTLNVQVAEDERESFNTLFINEARAAGSLSHPHIVTVFDAGISDRRAYIAMELLKGRDLRQLRQEGWRATPAQAALIVRRVADALAFAHSKGVIHRDIKPANIFMVGRTQPRVLDFGIARVVHRRESNDANSGAGSPYYMAPEQVKREVSDRRADVFSLGVVLYELLTDTKPFRGDTLAQIRDAVLNHEPPLASKVDATVPKALAAIAARAMAKGPEQRFRSARSFARELRQWLDENPVSSEGEPLVAKPAPQRRLGWMIGSALAVVVIAASAGLWFGLSARTGDVAAATAAEALRSTRVAAEATPVVAIERDPVVSTAAVPATVPPPEAVATTSAQAIEAAATPAAPLAGVDVVARSETHGLASALAVDATVAEAGPTPVARKTSQGTAATVAATSTTPSAATKPARETTKERRARETHERELRETDARIASAASLVAPPTGTVKIAVSPWGLVEVDGAAAGAAPPITELALAEGKHQIVVRNGDFAPYATTVVVTAGQSVTVRHRFGP